VTTAEIAGVLSDWFATATAAHLELPTGWPGRPWDDEYRLISATGTDDRLTIVLDDGQTITIDGPSDVQTSPRWFRIAGFREATRDWTGSITGEAHHDTFDAGVFKFHARI
jgi:hypothetical protein